MAQLLLEKITKIYPGNILALRQFDLRVPEGELVVLLGPSGSGKSTLLRVVAGLEEATEGEITLGGRVVTRSPPKDRDVALVFQNYALYPHLTVYGNLAFGLRLRKFAPQEIEKRIREAAGILGIEDLLPRRPETLSGGQRQRVALGKAMVRRPNLFLLDEPLSHLDAHLRLELRAEVKSLQKRLKTTALYVTHDQEEALYLGDRLVVLDHGVIQQVGSPSELYTKPSNRFVASFVGVPPMNFLAGQIRAMGNPLEQDGFHFDVSGASLSLPPELSVSLSTHKAKEKDLVLGIRPEHIKPWNSGESASAGSCLDVKATSVAELAGKKLLHAATLAGQKVVSKLDSDSDERIKEGQTIRLRIDMSQAHLFDSTGKNLTLREDHAG